MEAEIFCKVICNTNYKFFLFLLVCVFFLKVLCHLRIQKQEALWKEFLLQPSAEQSLIEGAVLISQWGQMKEEQLPSVVETERSIDGIVQRVTELMGNQKSPKEIFTFINKVLIEEMGFQIQNGHGGSKDNLLIDKVNGKKDLIFIFY